MTLIYSMRNNTYPLSPSSLHNWGNGRLLVEILGQYLY